MGSNYLHFIGHEDSKLTGIQIPYLDKIAHIVMYAIFAFLLLLAFHHLIQTNKKVILLIISVSLTYGILMEFAQKKIFYPAKVLK